ncbi:hypothetical protein LCGC14_2004630, partial [marine sediment metagenome]
MAQQGLPIIQGKDPLAGLRQALTGFVGSTLQGAQNQQLSQQLGQLFPQQNFQGITNPLALQAGVQAGLQQQQQQGALGLQAARPVTPLSRTGEQGREIRRLQTIPQNQRTPEQKASLKALLEPAAQVQVFTGDVERSTRAKLEQDIIGLDDTIATLEDIGSSFETQFQTFFGKGRAGLAAKLEKFNV